MKTNQPFYWKPTYPDYVSLAGWELEKEITAKILRLKLKFIAYGKMINRAELMRNACYMIDVAGLCKYSAIEDRLRLRHISIAEELLFDYREVLPND